MSEKHEAAKRLLQASQTMQALLTPEINGYCISSLARATALNARVIELLTRPETPQPDDCDDDEDEEGNT